MKNFVNNFQIIPKNYYSEKLNLQRYSASFFPYQTTMDTLVTCLRYIGGSEPEKNKLFQQRVMISPQVLFRVAKYAKSFKTTFLTNV